MFQVLYSPGAAKALQKMPKDAAIRIFEALEALSKSDNPKRHIKKLKGSFGVPLYSYRVGDYRIILSLSEKVLAIYVIDIGDRSTEDFEKSIHYNVYILLIHRECGGSRIPHPLGWG